jgi:hypothetical protein
MDKGSPGSDQITINVSIPGGLTSMKKNLQNASAVQGVAIRGDYTVAGVQLANRRADIPRLITTLMKIRATHFMQLMWDRDGGPTTEWPFGWEDFQLMAPEFQAKGLNLWAYLPPPSEPPATAARRRVTTLFLS